jgi:hypothetical protein
MELVQKRLFGPLCKSWKMVAPGLRITARQPHFVSHNYLKSLHRIAQDRSENPRVGGSIPSLGTSKIKGLAVMPLTPFLFLTVLYKDCTRKWIGGGSKRYFLSLKQGFTRSPGRTTCHWPSLSLALRWVLV